MRIVKVGVLAPTNKGIPLGVQGENRATQVEFDTRPWFSEYPYGTVSAVARRDGDPATYPLTLDVSDGTAVWQVSDTDTAKAGEGAVELTMTSGGARVRSLTFKTLVTASLTDSPVDDDAWYGWLDKAVVKVDETVQSAQRKMDEVDAEWTGIKADVTEKVGELGEVAAQAASDAHHAKVDAQATAKALESAEGSVAKAEAAAKRSVDAMLDADDSAVEASNSALSAGESAEAARLSADAAAKSAGDAATSSSNAAASASSAAGSAEHATAQKVAAENAKDAAESFKAGAEAAKGEAAASASNAATSATAAAKSASDAAASVDAINVIAPKNVPTSAKSGHLRGIAIGFNANASKNSDIVIGSEAASIPDGYSYMNVLIGGNALAKTETVGSVAIGSGSTISKSHAEFSVGGGNGEYQFPKTREITHVSTPTDGSSASTKKYTDDNDAKTLSEAKKYTDDNDAKTLAESKKYTDDNTSNALVGNVSGNLLHVDDAWPGKPLGVTIEGACKQDGTPSPENPVPIEVIENPVLHVLGRNLVDVNPYHVAAGSVGAFISCYIPANTTAYVSFKSSNSSNQTNSGGTAFSLYSKDGNDGAHNTAMKSVVAGLNRGTVIADFDAFKHLSVYGYKYPDVDFDVSDYQLEVEGYNDYRPYTQSSIPLTLPPEHPYLASLPDGTHDEIVIDKDGNASLVARVAKSIIPDNPTTWGSGYMWLGFPEDGAHHTNDVDVLSDKLRYSNANDIYKGNAIGISIGDIFLHDVVSTCVFIGDNDIANIIGSTIYYKLATPITYSLGKLDIPSLPETISNVWTDAELTTNMSMTYKRDINIAFDNLVQAVVAAAAGE